MKESKYEETTSAHTDFSMEGKWNVMKSSLVESVEEIIPVEKFEHTNTRVMHEKIRKVIGR